MHKDCSHFASCCTRVSDSCCLISTEVNSHWKIARYLLTRGLQTKESLIHSLVRSFVRGPPTTTLTCARTLRHTALRSCAHLLPPFVRRRRYNAAYRLKASSRLLRGLDALVAPSTTYSAAGVLCEYWHWLKYVTVVGLRAYGSYCRGPVEIASVTKYLCDWQIWRYFIAKIIAFST